LQELQKQERERPGSIKSRAGLFIHKVNQNRTHLKVIAG
jgi:hypothetical protein